MAEPAARLGGGLAALALALALGPAPAAAEALSGSLRVERGPGAEACPDTASLKAEVEGVAASPILSPKGVAEVDLVVVISRSPDAYTAVVTASGVRSGERTLTDPGPGCDVLARGLAVTLAILLGAGPGEVVSPLPDPGPPPAPKPPPPGRFLLPAIPESPREPKERTLPPITGSIGPAYTTGIVPSDAAGVTLLAEAYIPNVSFGVGVLWLPHDEIELASARHAAYAYAGARARTCARPPDFEQYGISACIRFTAGRRLADLVDERDGEILDEQDGAFVAFGPQLEISRRVVGPFGVYADLGLDIALLQDDLALQAGSQDLVDPSDPGLSFDMGVGVRFWLEPEPEAAPPPR